MDTVRIWDGQICCISLTLEVLHFPSNRTGMYFDFGKCLLPVENREDSSNGNWWAAMSDLKAFVLDKRRVVAFRYREPSLA